MATAEYEDVLQRARRLPLEERRQLREVLATLEEAQAPEAAVAHAYLKRIDALAARISAAWKDNVDAVDAVREQRREL